jgi:hypothetical protein
MTRHTELLQMLESFDAQGYQGLFAAVSMGSVSVGTAGAAAIASPFM